MLVRHVAVFDEFGNVHTFGPGDDVPGWARILITNPSVWDRVAESAEDDGPPPRSGKGSGEGPWRAYAAQKGVDVSEADGREEIIALLQAAGVSVE
ncbi:head-tail connector protein [Mycobacterium phage Cornie]|uniref:Uncharacterized protein n=1 Tax=Mycobacterium phage Cornie TaxID=2704043 RepID=A0A6G6XKK4_9CAUD|nr:head-tail connector protein [Mycobacterium phage Cornie]QIG58385.1 hypothetical protein SEA_CORNIE_7 [Mycobacterium phage Cornie]